MNNKIERFEDLECWKTARKLVASVYEQTRTNPFANDWSLKDQIQRSAVSIMSNIAEGFGCFSQLEFSRFLRISLRSGFETQSHLYVALDSGYIETALFDELYQQAEKCIALLKGFLKYLRNRQNNT